MDVENILKVIGSAASIIFAAWIFMGFLQARYDAAFERYIDAIKEYRQSDSTDRRRRYLKQEISTYRVRCSMMNVASSVGLISAIFLLASPLAGELVILLPKASYLAYVSAVSALIGFSLVIVAAVIVFFEGLIIYRQLGRHAWDVSDFD